MGRESKVHTSRLKFFGDSNLEVTEELREHVAAQGIVLRVETIREHRWNTDMQDYELLVRWEGLEAIEDCWEPFKAMRRDVEHLRSQSKGQQAHHLSQLISYVSQADTPTAVQSGVSLTSYRAVPPSWWRLERHNVC
ncbi:hypothetical protein PC123_g26621 [Phytophthora cactorum]|nr:hypothetical protein PC123_g26621 [Phytophthora cactorum]